LFRNRLSRRNFLKKSSFGTLSGVLATAERIPAESPSILAAIPEDLMRCAVIGFGEWGREIAKAIHEVEDTELSTICDVFPLILRRAQRDFPSAHRETDYTVVLADETIHAVFVATPTHLHKDIVIAALEAGKHVYCEAPIAHTIEDARAIAQAAKKAKGQIFQAGLLYRTEPQYRSVFGFIRSGALGKTAMVRSQWHYKDSWRRTSSSNQREQALNWRLDQSLSLGLVGEIGIQQIDTCMWINGQLPSAVSGFGSVMYWQDGRTVPDTTQSLIEFPNGENMLFDATLVSGFDAMYDLYFGSDSTIILRDNKAWMFKEVDAPQLGWEVYARKDKFYKETGIALLANATKLDAIGTDPTADDPNAKAPIWHAVKAFADNFNYGPFDSVVNYQTAYEATVVAIKASEAVKTGSKITFLPEWFSIDG
jgi:predicted dehydrogenase